MNKIHLPVVIIGIAVVIGAVYLAFAAPPQAIIIRLVTANPPSANGLILPQLEKRNFDPDKINLKLGVPNTIVIVSNDDIETHQFSIPTFNITTPPIKPFDSYEFTFTPTKAGTFKFIDPRPEENYTRTDYRGIQVTQTVNHSVETGNAQVNP